MTQTDKPSVEGVNRKIAEFMGYTFDDNGVVRSGPDDLLKLVKHSVFLDVRHCKFHSSWEWLMPVVEKIEALFDGNISVEIAGECCSIELGTQYAMAYDIHLPSTFFERTESKLKSTHESVYQFILWYNQHHTPDGDK